MIEAGKLIGDINARGTDGVKRYLINEVFRLCARALHCQRSRTGGDLASALDALEEQRHVVEHILADMVNGGRQ